MLYTYAIISDATSQQVERGIGHAILAGARPRCYTRGGLSAVASAVPASEFGPEILPERLGDADWTRDRVLAHEAVVADLLAMATVLPLKFCTLFSGEAALFAALDGQGERLQAAAGRCRGAREWGLKLFLEERARVEPAPLVPAAPGAGAAFFRRKHEDRERAEAVEARMARCVADIHDALRRHAREAVVNPPQPAALHRRAARMVLNGAYLVSREEEVRWHGALKDMAALCTEHGLSAEATGPWGPYNFAGGGLVGT